MTDVIKMPNQPLRAPNPTSTGLLRSVPPVHSITTLEARILKTSPAPTPMTKLPNKADHKKLLAKVVGFDAGSLIEPSKHHRHGGMHSPRHGRSMRENTTPHPTDTEVEIRGQAFPGTPRLLKGGNSKMYGIRRQISPENTLELSPDIAPPPTADSAHLVSSDFVLTSVPMTASRKVAVTNKLQEKGRRDAPWVYCFKVKRDRLRMSNLIVTSTSPVDNLNPAVI